MRTAFALSLLVMVAMASPDRCIVCGKEAMEGDEPLVHRGREVLVCSRTPCREEWAANPEPHFRQVQARGALYDEEAIEGAIGVGWLIFGVYMLAGTVVGGVCAYLAVTRGLRPLPWFLAGVAGNVVTLAVVLARRGDTSGLPAGVPAGLRKVPTTYGPVYCPKCGAEHHPSATACRACGGALEPTVESEARRAR